MTASPRTLIEQAITSTLAAKGITAPLGRPVAELLPRGFSAPAAPRPAADEQLAALQQKVHAMTLQEVGAVTRLTSQYFGARHDADQQDALAQLLYYGIEAFIDTAAEVARLYNRNLSSSAQKRLLQANLGKLDEVVDRYRTRLEDRALGVVNGELGQEIERLEGEYRSALAEATEQATRGLDQAQAEATEQRRLLDAASAQLARERAAHAAEVQRLTVLLEGERRAHVERERAARNELHQLRQDLANQRGTVAHLNAECARLEERLGEATRPALSLVPEVLTMPTHNPALANLSLAAYLREQDFHTTVDGNTGRLQTHGDIPEALEREWAVKYPDDASRLAQLRALLRPLLRRAA